MQAGFWFNVGHSHKKRKDSLETWAIYKEISMNCPKHRGSLLKSMAGSERDQLLARTFDAIMDKIEADLLQIIKKWNWKWIFHSKNTFLRDSSYTWQSCTKVPAPLRLVSQIWAKYKAEVSMCQVPTKILKRHAWANSSLQNLKICVSKKDESTYQ